MLLDEIGELDARIQPKLLRLIENQEVQPIGQPRPSKVDVRILAATNADIDEMVRDSGSARICSIVSASSGSTFLHCATNRCPPP